VDVGRSGALVMNWFRSILPPHLRDQVRAFALKNDHRQSINPFDTQHGLDRPTNDDSLFLVAVLGTLAPGCGPESGKFYERIINVAYDKFSRQSEESKRWQDGIDRDVSKVLHASLDNIRSKPGFEGFVLDEHTRVWDVVDALFAVGEIEASVSAQRFAMPTLQDLPKIAQDPRVVNVYGGATHNGERIVDIFVRNITSALDSYQILSGYTRFNIGAARAVAIDLQEVVGSMASEEGRRRSGLMFLLARRIGARNYFLHWDDVARFARRCMRHTKSVESRRFGRE